MSKQELPESERLDFHYLLTLMPPLHDVPEFAWLPELFSIIDIDSFLNLCKYCGGETIRIPTLAEVSKSVDAMQCFYDIEISKRKTVDDIPEDLKDLVRRVIKIYNARDSKAEDSPTK